MKRFGFLTGSLLALFACSFARANDAQTFLDAIENGDEKAVTSMIAHSPALAKTANEFGVPALVLSIGKGHPEIVELLLKKGANPNDAGKGASTPVAAAMALRYDGREMRALINAGGNVNYASSAYGQTPLMIGARAGDLETAQLLIKKGAKMTVADDTLGWTPLHYAATSANAELVQFFLKSGAKADATDKEGKTALSLVQNSRGAPWARGKDYSKVIAALRGSEKK